MESFVFLIIKSVSFVSGGVDLIKMTPVLFITPHFSNYANKKLPPILSLDDQGDKEEEILS